MNYDPFILVMLAAGPIAGWLVLSFVAATLQCHQARLDAAVKAEKKRRRRAAILAETPIEVS